MCWSVSASGRSVNTTGLNSPNTGQQVWLSSIIDANYTGFLPVKTVKLTVELTESYIKVQS